MLLAQATEATEALQGFNQVPIIVGMFVMIIAFIAYEKYIRKTPKLELSGLQAIEITNVMNEKMSPAKVEFTGLQAMEITTEMINKILQTPVDGHSVEKRAAKLHHDVTEALKNKDDIANVLITISEGQDRFIGLVEDAYKTQAESRVQHHKETLELQEKYLKELVKNKSNGNNRNK